MGTDRAEAAPVSVVIAVHDGAAHLRETLLSVSHQEHLPAQVIVVDDGSSDDSAAIAEATLPTIHLVRHARAKGVSHARNAGLELATQPWVCFLDQDDVWHPRHVARQVAAFERHPDAGAVVCPYLHWPASATGYASPHTVWPQRSDENEEDAAFSGWVYHQFLLDCWALTSATMVRREVVMRVGAFDAEREYGEDWDLWLRLSRETQFVKLQGVPVLYRQHPGQGSRRARAIDHRSELLLKAASEHGLASRDGRAVPPTLFRRTLARYRMEFGLHHLIHGDAAIGRGALWQAWRRDPLRLRYLGLAAAAAAGWRPAATA